MMKTSSGPKILATATRRSSEIRGDAARDETTLT